MALKQDNNGMAEDENKKVKSEIAMAWDSGEWLLRWQKRIDEYSCPQNMNMLLIIACTCSNYAFIWNTTNYNFLFAKVIKDTIKGLL